ncbi:MAG TPA: VanW family protein [Thermomicrobiales bacterium]|nr:VanW family protein [Thermomicrobiales bacterium]
MRARQHDAVNGPSAHVPLALGQGIASVLRSVSVATMALLAVLLLAVFLLAFAPLGYEGKVLPGVRIAGIAVGGLSETAALARVQDHTASLAEQPVTLTVDGQTWTPLPGDLGITYDPEQAVDAAMAVGRNDVPNPTTHDAGLGMLPLSIQFNAVQFNAYLNQIEAELGFGSRDAAVTINGLDVMVTPAQEGWVIDRTAVQVIVRNQVDALQPVTVSVPLQKQAAAISTEQAEATKAILDQALAEPLTLMLGDREWAIAPEQFGPAVRVTAGEGGTLTVTLDAEGLDALVAPIAADIETETKDAWVQDLGTHQWLVPAQQGRTLQRGEFARALGSAVAHGQHSLDLDDLVVTDDTPPKVTTEGLMAELGITDLLAVGDSVFAGSGPGRAHNVAHAAYRIDGTLVPAGGVFSFNDAVGSLFSGEFTDAGSYIDGPSGQSLAGGVCQVSTTVYRAALEAGLPIVEWWPHSYRSPFYETAGWSPGYDASIVQDGNVPEASTDFRFENTTGSWLLVRAIAADDGTLRVELLGADPGYTVEFDEPIIEVIEQAPTSVDVVADPALPAGTVLPDQSAMDGLRVTVVRRVSDASGQHISTDTFVSSYRAYGAIRRVSPDME